MRQFRSILVHVDTRLSDLALFEQSVDLAKAHGGALKIVEIVPDLPGQATVRNAEFKEMLQLLVEKKTKAVEKLSAVAQQRGVAATHKVLSGKSSVELIAEVLRAGHDLVMKSAKGPESRRAGFLGTTATRLMRFCPCAVWAFRPRRSAGDLRVVAAVDATPTDKRHADLNREILDVALGLSPASPDVVYAWTVYGERLIKDYMTRDDFEMLVKEGEKEERDHLRDLLKPLGISADSPQVHLLHGAEEQEIARFVDEQQFDALVIGTVGRSGLSGMFIGNTAETLLGHVSCSVIAVKPAEFVTPVASS